MNGFSLGRGWYAIALGPYRRDEAERVLQVYRREGVIARDSYIAETSDYQRQFWPIGRTCWSSRRWPRRKPPTTSSQPLNPPPRRWTRPRARPAPAKACSDREERASCRSRSNGPGSMAGPSTRPSGSGTRGAMARWQEENGFEATGILTTRQRAELLRQYNAVFEGLAWNGCRQCHRHRDADPDQVVEFDRYEPPFAHFNPAGDLDARVLLISQSGDRNTMAGLYDIMQTLEIVPETGPRSLEADSFTLIGEGALRISHTQVWHRDGEIKGFTLIWPAGDEERRNRLIQEMQDSFEWLPGTLDPARARNRSSASTSSPGWKCASRVSRARGFMSMRAARS